MAEGRAGGAASGGGGIGSRGGGGGCCGSDASAGDTLTAGAHCKVGCRGFVMVVRRKQGGWSHSNGPQLLHFPM